MPRLKHHESPALRRFARYRHLFDALCVLGSRMTDARTSGPGKSADPAARAAAEREYAETLAEIRRAQAGPRPAAPTNPPRHCPRNH